MKTFKRTYSLSNPSFERCGSSKFVQIYLNDSVERSTYVQKCLDCALSWRKMLSADKKGRASEKYRFFSPNKSDALLVFVY